MTEKDAEKSAQALMFGIDDTDMSDINVIIKDLEELENIEEIQDVEPLIRPFVNEEATFRTDEPSEPIEADILFSNAKDVLNDQIKVPKVVQKWVN